VDAPGSGRTSQGIHRIPLLTRDPELDRIDQQLRMAIRDAVNRSTRKPFSWGGLAGYQQLEAIDEALTQLTTLCPERTYFQQLSRQVKRALDKNRTLADNVKEAHQWLQQISACLR